MPDTNLSTYCLACEKVGTGARVSKGLRSSSSGVIFPPIGIMEDDDEREHKVVDTAPNSLSNCTPISPSDCLTNYT